MTGIASARRALTPHMGLTHQSGPLPFVQQGDLLPRGGKVRGVNITATPAQELAAMADSPLDRWSHLWGDWDATAIQQHLDRAVTAGCNTVRIQGTVYGIYTGKLTRAQYLSHWTDLSGWCQQRGLFMYPTGCDGGGNDGFGSVPFDTTIAEITAWAELMNSLPDVIGLDIVQEDDGWRSTNAHALTLYQAVKAVTALPCTYSVQTTMDATSNLTPTFLADRMDFFDFHLYQPGIPALSAQLDAYWNAGGIRPILIGEFSHNQGVTTTAVDWAARYNDVLGLVNHIGPKGKRVTGALPWASGDSYAYTMAAGSNSGPGQNYGIFDIDGLERKYLTSILRTFPIR